MSNEELAVAIQNGDIGYTETLWRNVKRFVAMLAFRFYGRFQSRCKQSGITNEDLMQVGFIALMDAVKDFNPATGYKFLTYLKLQCKRHFYLTLGLHTKREANDPIRNFNSLNEPLKADSEDSERIDFISDPESEAPFEDVIDTIWRQDLREAEEKALQLLNPRQADIVRRHYFEAKSLLQIAEDDGIVYESVRQIEKKAIKRLQSKDCLEILKPFHDDEYITLGLRGTSFTAFKNRGSSTERAVELLEIQRYKNLREQVRQDAEELWMLVNTMNTWREEVKSSGSV